MQNKGPTLKAIQFVVTYSKINCILAKVNYEKQL